MTFFCFLYLLATELIAAQRSKGEIFIHRRSFKGPLRPASDEEAKIELQHSCEYQIGPQERAFQISKKESTPARTPAHTVPLLWQGLGYHLGGKSVQHTLLDDIEGWIQPGSLTALTVRDYVKIRNAEIDMA